MQLPGSREAWQHFQKAPAEDWAPTAAQQLTRCPGKLLTPPPHDHKAWKRKFILSSGHGKRQCTKTEPVAITTSPYQRKNTWRRRGEDEESEIEKRGKKLDLNYQPDGKAEAPQEQVSGHVHRAATEAGETQTT